VIKGPDSQDGRHARVSTHRRVRPNYVVGRPSAAFPFCRIGGRAARRSMPGEHAARFLPSTHKPVRPLRR
jgi:hypothetical protein